MLYAVLPHRRLEVNKAGRLNADLPCNRWYVSKTTLEFSSLRILMRAQHITRFQKQKQTCVHWEAICLSKITRTVVENRGPEAPRPVPSLFASISQKCKRASGPSSNCPKSTQIWMPLNAEKKGGNKLDTRSNDTDVLPSLQSIHIQ